MYYNTDFLKWHKILAKVGSQSEMKQTPFFLLRDVFSYFIFRLNSFFHTFVHLKHAWSLMSFSCLVFFIPSTLNDFFSESTYISRVRKKHVYLTLLDHMLLITGDPDITVSSTVLRIGPWKY